MVWFRLTLDLFEYVVLRTDKCISTIRNVITGQRLSIGFRLAAPLVIDESTLRQC